MHASSRRSHLAIAGTRSAFGIFSGQHLALASLLLAASAFAQPAATKPLDTAPSGKSLVLPQDAASKGTVYYALTGSLDQLMINAITPNTKITAKTKNIIGYVVAGPVTNPATIQQGEWHLAVDKISTGHADHDTAIKTLLDASKAPTIVMRLSKPAELKPVESKIESIKAFKATLDVELTLAGVTRPLTLEASAAAREESDLTKLAFDGDVLSLRTSIKITLADFGITEDRIKAAGLEGKIGPTLECNLNLGMCTVPPENQPERTKPTPAQSKPGTIPATRIEAPPTKSE